LKSTDYQVAGDHYKKLKIQPIEYIMANQLPFAEGCIVKYATSWRDKGGMDDLRKIKQFCDFIIELCPQSIHPHKALISCLHA
jgi:hypothetical protein